MKNHGDFQVISLQSRKGGVGKTTVALYLSQLLIKSEKANRIFLLDFDMTGTSIDDVETKAMPKFLSEGLHIVKIIDKNEENKKKKLDTVNLVNMFEKYMHGDPVPDASGKNNAPVYFDLDKKKEKKKKIIKKRIIIFPSFIEPKGAKKNAYYGPSVLFDEMHASFFMEMVFELVKKCNLAFKADENKPNIFIIDNAPGYSGLEPEVEKWLLKLGPQSGKFLFVSTLDPQDLTACLKGMKSVHERFLGMEKISHYYHKFKNKVDIENVKEKLPKVMEESKEFAKFFTDLVTEEPLDIQKCRFPTPEIVDPPSCTGCGFCFYRDQDKDAEKAAYRKNPREYMGLIINKVPTLFIDDTFEHNYKNKKLLKDADKEIDNDSPVTSEIGDAEERSAVYQLLKSALIDKKSRHMIPFDAKWATMFYCGLVSLDNTGSTNVLDFKDGFNWKNIKKRLEKSIFSIEGSSSIDSSEINSKIKNLINSIWLMDSELGSCLKDVPASTVKKISLWDHGYHLFSHCCDMALTLKALKIKPWGEEQEWKPDDLGNNIEEIFTNIGFNKIWKEVIRQQHEKTSCRIDLLNEWLAGFESFLIPAIVFSDLFFQWPKNRLRFSVLMRLTYSILLVECNCLLNTGGKGQIGYFSHIFWEDRIKNREQLKEICSAAVEDLKSIEASDSLILLGDRTTEDYSEKIISESDQLENICHHFYKFSHRSIEIERDTRFVIDCVKYLWSARKAAKEIHLDFLKAVMRELLVRRSLKNKYAYQMLTMLEGETAVFESARQSSEMTEFNKVLDHHIEKWRL